MDRRVGAGGRSTGSVIQFVPLVNSICSWISAELFTCLMFRPMYYWDVSSLRGRSMGKRCSIGPI